MPKERYLSERVLQAVRGRIGVEDNESDTSQDERIYAMDSKAIVRAYAGWVLGSEAWAIDFISVIEQVYGITLPRE